VVELATQQHGCRVVQSVLQVAAGAGMDISEAVEQLVRGGLLPLALHRFANYAVQVACHSARAPQRAQVLGTLLAALPSLATSKHGSNVAEVVLSVADDAQLEEVHTVVFGPSAAAADTLGRFLDCPYANYVVQTLLRRTPSDERRAAALELVRLKTTESNYGRSVLTKFHADGRAGAAVEAQG